MFYNVEFIVMILLPAIQNSSSMFSIPETLYKMNVTFLICEYVTYFDYHHTA
jgi:hypothetical protein